MEEAGGIKIKFKRKRDGQTRPHAFQEPAMCSSSSPAVKAEDTSIPMSESGSGEPHEIYSAKSVRISDFPSVFRHRIARVHQSVSTLVALDRGEVLDDRVRASLPLLENISHGQIQVTSTSPPDDVDKLESVGLLEFKGVIKRLKRLEQNNNEECFYAFPMHADWFSFDGVNKMEYQVVPEYFSGKSNEHTPQKYMEIRNTIVNKYLENPERPLSLSDVEGLVNADAHHWARIFEFLDHWGIINYSAKMDSRQISFSDNKEVLQEDANGEVHLSPGSLRSIESLIRFEQPRSRSKAADICLPSGCSSNIIADLESRIQERLSEHRCTYCSSFCSEILFQSQKETDIVLCSECFNNGKPIVGMSSVDFVRVDISKDVGDLDGSNWTDQETLLLLEALENFGDNWSAIAEHVGTKSKAQCMLHFIRLPMETDLLDSIDIPDSDVISNHSKEAGEMGKRTLFDDKVKGSSGDALSENRIVFANSGNPVMTLIAFLASAVGPRVAAACAHAALVVLSKEDSTIETGDEKVGGKDTVVDRLNIENDFNKGGNQEVMTALNEKRDQKLEESEKLHANNDILNVLSSVPLEKVRLAAMAGLSAAAVKAKLFAEQEEREIQKLTASIVTNQLKRLDFKLKQFGEIESLLMKECDQVERSRQKLSADRGRFISNHIASSSLGAGNVAPSPPPSMPMPMSNRPVISCTMPTAPRPMFVPTVMPFIRPSVYTVGPGGVGSPVPVPLSTMQSLSAVAPGTVLTGTAASNLTATHNMFRPPVGGSGANTSTN